VEREFTTDDATPFLLIIMAALSPSDILLPPLTPELEEEWEEKRAG